MTTNEKNILYLCGVGHFFAHFYMLVFPSLALWIHDDFEMTLADTLNLGFVMYLFFGLLALPMGYLGDRWGNRPMLVGMLIGIGLSSLSAGVSPGPTTLTVSMAGIGLFAAIYHPVGIGLISKCCINRGRALGNNGVWGNLGIGLAPLLAGIGAYLIDWRLVYVVFGLINIVLGIVLMRLKIDEEPLSHAHMSRAEKETGNLSYFCLMLVCMALLGLCYRGTVVSIPAYFEEKIVWLGGLFQMESEFEISASHTFGTTLLVSAIYLFGIFGQLTGGWLADRLDLRTAYLSFHSLSLPFMLAMGFATGVPLFIVALGYLFFSLGMQPIENSLVARLTPNHLRSLAYGLKFVLVLGMGAFAVKMVKWVMTYHETRLIYLVQSGLIATVIGLIVVLFVSSRGRSFRNR